MSNTLKKIYQPNFGNFATECIDNYLKIVKKKI